MDDLVLHCPVCREAVERRQRFVDAAPNRIRKDSYYWCCRCKLSFRIQKICLQAPVAKAPE